MTDEELKILTESNAKAIQALAEQKLELEQMLCTAMMMCANAQAMIARCYAQQYTSHNSNGGISHD